MKVAGRPPAHAPNSFDTFGTLRVALVSHIPPLLEGLGCSSAPVLRRAGIPSRLLANPENRIGYYAVGRLVEESVRTTGLPHFGLLAGERFDPATALGDVIELMQNAPSIGAALRAFVLHQHLNDTGAVPTLLPEHGRRVALTYTMLSHAIPAIDAFYDAGMAYGMQIMRLLCGRNWRPLRVKFACRRPADVSPYTLLFGSPPSFDCNVYAFEFAPGLLKQPVASAAADPDRYAALRDELQQRLLHAGHSFADQVKRALVPSILAGTASAPNVAALFSLHERVLRSRLAAEGTSVRQLIQNTRLELAAQLLQSTRLSVGDISTAVGYADPPSFVRAFRNRFTAATPGEWRKQAGSAGVAD